MSESSPGSRGSRDYRAHVGHWSEPGKSLPILAHAEDSLNYIPLRNLRNLLGEGGHVWNPDFLSLIDISNRQKDADSVRASPAPMEGRPT